MADDAQNEALRASDAQVGVHALGNGFETVRDGPEHLHEHQGVAQRLELGSDWSDDFQRRVTQRLKSSQNGTHCASSIQSWSLSSTSSSSS